ncbi:hypothetical protein GMLC_32720 [Geomonas limicola]|uniref:DNA-binding protein n=1 Tax=Geomonas limicola TaxID=2740186 RepID=A0A6V8NDQ1_9BACT|nr:hypothetical protein [Geomonas limicola]GFO69693.1 hypothetical protein GMLC_32720 [Geomonas limicola]
MKSFSKALLVVLALTIPTVCFSADTPAHSEKAAPGKITKVSDLYKNKDSLDKKQVTVKGKVVKVSSGIMDRNWIHIQDGSGKAATKDNDLTVTTSKDLPAVGQTVTITGTLTKNKDFGSGYFYAVIVEGATVK